VSARAILDRLRMLKVVEEGPHGRTRRSSRVSFDNAKWHGDTVPRMHRQAVPAPRATPGAVPSFFATKAWKKNDLGVAGSTPFTVTVDSTKKKKTQLIRIVRPEPSRGSTRSKAKKKAEGRQLGAQPLRMNCGWHDGNENCELHRGFCVCLKSIIEHWIHVAGAARGGAQWACRWRGLQPALGYELGAAQTDPPSARGGLARRNNSAYFEMSPASGGGRETEKGERQGEQDLARPHTSECERGTEIEQSPQSSSGCEGNHGSVFSLRQRQRRGYTHVLQSSRRSRLSIAVLVGLIALQGFPMASFVTAFQTPTSILIDKGPAGNNAARQVFAIQPEVLSKPFCSISVPLVQPSV